MTPTPKQIKVLRTLALEQANYEAAGRKFDAAFRSAVKAGCSQSDIAIELGVSRQAVHQRLRQVTRLEEVNDSFA